jgi:hypothetical protein
MHNTQGVNAGQKLTLWWTPDLENSQVHGVYLDHVDTGHAMQLNLETFYYFTIWFQLCNLPTILLNNNYFLNANPQ